ncbi:fimbrial assembly protein [Paraburkholderia sp. BCC1885]|uniref:fimbrial assembly protein n=1 Tax=Paraburkholderia sp. BCC1885 TaxID=2562669 RepID=UPI001183EF82|nr:fimbrial assembly protein [Paraburkholderia sp. BCC1885]
MSGVNARMSAAGRPVWIGGFNLLPHRQRNARLARRRCLIEWLAAVLVGCAAVLTIVGWQAFERTRLDAQRAATERELASLAAPLAEQARLRRDAEEQGKRAARAVVLTEPLTRLLDLLDMLSRVPADGVVLQQLKQHAHETELLATSTDPVASSLWLKQLSTIRGVRSSEVADLHPLAQVGRAASAVAGGPVEFVARLQWGEATKDAGQLSATASARPPASDKSRGAR